MSIQPNFFESITSGGGFIEPEPPAQTKREKRLAVAQKTFEKENELWKQMFCKFILNYARTHATFSPEEIRHVYAANKKLPQPERWQSSGHLFKKLAKEGYLKIVDSGISDDHGCPIRVYSIGEKRETAQFSAIGK